MGELYGIYIISQQNCSKIFFNLQRSEIGHIQRFRNQIATGLLGKLLEYMQQK